MGTAAEVLDRLLARHCTACGAGLPEPGLPCTGCGTLPRITRAEAAERLAAPGAVAAVEAAELREQARRLQEKASERLAGADRIEHLARLELARDEAASHLPAARGEAARLAGELENARAREREAKATVKDSRANYRAAAVAEETARRTRASAATRTDALARANAAAAVLEADQAAQQAAAAERERAQQALAVACDRAGVLEEEFAAAQRAVDSPGRIPKSTLTLTLDLSRQAVSGDLTESEQAAVRALAGGLASLSGAAADIAGHAVERHRQDTEEAAGNRRVITTPLGDGFVAAWPNPLVPPPATP